MFKQISRLWGAFLLSMLPFTGFTDEKLDLELNYYDCPTISATFETVVIKGKSEGVIILSDGSQWVVKNRADDEVFHEISTSWKRGDEVRIGWRTPEKYQGEYILKNVRNKGTCLVDLDAACQDRSKAYFIEQIDTNGYAIITQDGSEWAIGWLGAFTTGVWKKGDRLVINKSDHSNYADYLLINADKGGNVWASLITWK